MKIVNRAVMAPVGASLLFELFSFYMSTCSYIIQFQIFFTYSKNGLLLYSVNRELMQLENELGEQVKEEKQVLQDLKFKQDQLWAKEGEMAVIKQRLHIVEDILGKKIALKAEEENRLVRLFRE